MEGLIVLTIGFGLFFVAGLFADLWTSRQERLGR